MEEKIASLVSQMTLDEKISMLAGADLWNTIPVERLGVPSIRVTDGPNGARGTQGSMAPTSVDAPVGVALGATWNTGLVNEVGKVLAEETREKGAHILLAPTVNIHRSPLAGRNFECYSEDPYLTGLMAIAYINGLQSQGVGACIKHFVCNDSEFERMSMNSEVADRPLREIYLRPFEMAIKEARPWSLMSAYNRVNGVYASENTTTLLDILKGEWGFDGSVISDWFGSYSPKVNPNGLDLEMPGPARWTSRDKVLGLLESGELSEAMIDDKVRRLLRTIIRVGGYDRPGPLPEQSVDKPEHRQVMLQAATEAIVLLKNEGSLLPFNLKQVKTIAVIGENAKLARVMGGGSSSVTPHYVVSPLEGILKCAGQAIEVVYAIGASINRQPPPLDAGMVSVDGGQNGLRAEIYANDDLSGQPVETMILDRTDITWSDRMLAKVDPINYSARLSAILTPTESGSYTFSLESSGKSRLLIDERVCLDNWTDREADSPPWREGGKQAQVSLEADKDYPFVIEFSSHSKSPWRVLRIGCQPPVPTDSIDRAVELARRSDVVVLFAGLSDDWESEGFDRLDMELRGAQVELIEKVVAANPRTVVVLNTGSPVTMPWLDKIPAVLEAWYAGQEAGNAIAAVLFGAANPSGKLPTTFPKRLQDTPAYINYPGENGRVTYGEGIFVGYRYYDMKDVEPLFPFGHGLSYTNFEYRNLSLGPNVAGTQFLNRAGASVQVSLEVSNSGQCVGQEVVQLYLRDVEASLSRPVKELKAFTKIELKPGEVQQITFNLDERAFAFYNPANKNWVVEGGTFEILVGSSSRDIRLSATLEI